MSQELKDLSAEDLSAEDLSAEDLSAEDLSAEDLSVLELFNQPKEIGDKYLEDLERTYQEAFALFESEE